MFSRFSNGTPVSCIGNVSEVCSTQADLFTEQEHFDAPAIVAKKAALMERYEKLKVSLGTDEM